MLYPCIRACMYVGRGLKTGGGNAGGEGGAVLALDHFSQRDGRIKARFHHPGRHEKRFVIALK